MVDSLKDEAVAYMSFKWGEFSSIDDWGRHFTNQTTNSLRLLLGNMENTQILEIWDSEIELRGQPQKWVYAIIRRRGDRV